jgi:hypothetical protein
MALRDSEGTLDRHSEGTLDRQGTAVAQWLRCCATNRKVAGSITAGVSGFFIFPSDCTMTLGSTQPPTEMSTRNISWG